VGAFFGPAGVPPIPPPPSGNITFFPAAGTISGTKSICILAPSMTSCGVGWPAGVDVFYTLDGSAANEASQWYSCKTNTSGCITLPDPTSSRQVIINAVAVQTANTTLPGCSPTHPCIGVVVVDGHLIPSQGNTNVACSSSSSSPGCPAANFAQSSPPFGTRTSASNPPPVQHGSCTSPTGGTNLGTRGVVGMDWYYTAQPQPLVDPYVNSNTMVEMDFGTTSAVDCGLSLTEPQVGDTEILVPAIHTTNQLTGSSGTGATACDKCTNFAVSYYIANVYEGTPPSGTTLNPAYTSEIEADANQSNATFNTATGYGYGSFNLRASMFNAAPVTVGGVVHGQWEYSNQSGSWKAFPLFFPSVASVAHDAPLPFGTIAALTSSSTDCGITFTPGTTIYKGSGNTGPSLEVSYPLEPGFLLVDQGTTSAESILLLGSPGGSITGCMRGAGGTTPHSHAANALATEMVKVMSHATQAMGTGSSGCSGSSAAVQALFMDYVSINGNYYGTGLATGTNTLDFQTLMGKSLGTPTINVLNTWGTQTASGAVQSKVCSWFYSGLLGDRFWDQKQPYTKPGEGNPALIGIFDQHDNVTASWGIIGSPQQAVYTQLP
jgi:hypothetical protein